MREKENEHKKVNEDTIRKIVSEISAKIHKASPNQSALENLRFQSLLGQIVQSYFIVQNSQESIIRIGSFLVETKQRIDIVETKLNAILTHLGISEEERE